MGGQRAPAGRRQSQRQLRVGEALRHVLAELLMRGAVHDPLLAEAHLTVSEVRMSRDLRHAVVYRDRARRRAARPSCCEALARAAPGCAARWRAACV